MQLQRGLQVYTEICSGCHGLQYVPIRTLGDEGGPGLPDDQVRAYAEFWEVFDPSLDGGLGDFRPAIPNDNFPGSQLEGAPDLSLMAKGRAGFHGPYGLGINQFFKGIGGPEYIAALLQGYEDPPSCAPEDFDGSYNTVFAAGGYPEECKDENGKHKYPGSWIGMAQPLYGDDIEFADGHSADLEHISADVAAFLMWTAEPKLAARKQAGFAGVLMLTVLSVLLYLTNKRIWAPVKGKGRKED
jgi:ubiquinol-cytochrome c reductase cytochrome c1 subunit